MGPLGYISRAMDAVPHNSPHGLRFRKMHGLGNDFVVIDARDGADPMTPALARALADRRRGVGCDQIAVLRDPGEAAADVAVAFWNADGSRAGACGNATRCIARLMLDEGRGPAVALAVEGRGLLQAWARADGLIAVDMGEPVTDWRAIPLAREVDPLALPLPGEPVAVSMGNPHCVHFLDSLEGLDFEPYGAEVEQDPLFPERTNVQFAEVIDRGRIRVLVWERGAGRTPASGSSACAVAVAAHLTGLADRRVTIELEGGALEIEWRDSDDHVLMAGPAADVYEGVLSPDWIAVTA